MHLSSRPIKRKKKKRYSFFTNSLDLYNLTQKKIMYIYSRVLVRVFIQYLFAEEDRYTHLATRRIHIYLYIYSYKRKSINHFFFRISFHCIKLKLQINTAIGRRRRGEDAALRHHLRACMSIDNFSLLFE